MTNYSFKIMTKGKFDEVVERTKEALAKQGFGVLTEIDVKATMKKKLDLEMDDYLILGACNPKFAAEALDSELEVGLLMPCNVIVYSKDGNIFVSAIRPEMAMSFIGNKQLCKVAARAEEQLQKAVASI